MRPRLFPTAIISAAASVLSTYAVQRFLTERVSIIGSFVGFERAYNPGIAFSIRLPGPLQTILLACAAVAVLILALRPHLSRLEAIGFGLILGGAAGNIVDRLPDGLVTDFIQISIWPTFNVADSCITVGVGLLLFHILRQKMRTSP